MAVFSPFDPCGMCGHQWFHHQKDFAYVACAQAGCVCADFVETTPEEGFSAKVEVVPTIPLLKTRVVIYFDGKHDKCVEAHCAIKDYADKLRVDAKIVRTIEDSGTSLEVSSPSTLVIGFAEGFYAACEKLN